MVQANHLIVFSTQRLFRVAAAAAALTAIVLLGLLAAVVRVHVSSQRILAEQGRLKELIGTIVHLDEVLTMSARMAAATGDPTWEARYRQFEPELDTAIQEARGLARGMYSEQDVSQTDAANLRLVQLENEAFVLARQGRLPEAFAHVSNTEYQTYKQVYAQGMERLAGGLRTSVQRMVDKEETIIRFIVTGASMCLILLLMAWTMVLRMVRRWQTVLFDSNRELSARTYELEALNRSLDARVAERTGALTTSNDALQAEVKNRRAAEHALAEKVHELETLNSTMMGREERILEMKKEVNDLMTELGREHKYSG